MAILLETRKILFEGVLHGSDKIGTRLLAILLSLGGQLFLLAPTIFNVQQNSTCSKLCAGANYALGRVSQRINVRSEH
jgi:hypothetical protein